MASQSQNSVNVNPPANGQSASPDISAPKSSQPTQETMQQQQQQEQHQQQTNNFEPIDKSSSNTLKRNPKMKLKKKDLLKLLGYLEGELQARDIVIAALKSEKMKHLLNSRYLCGTNDAQAALARDDAVLGGVIVADKKQVDQQVASLEALVMQQRRTQCRMAKVLKDAEIRHRAVIKELEEEKRKHEHDTAQGDDITYGLEKERTRLKKELEVEKQEKKRIELELKKANDTLEEEKNRQKQIVLLLLAERKKIIMKYIEERKRSEDLAQILSEEKVRIDSMAEGLEEESKKSLQMEAELEKQLAQFDMERQQYRQAIIKEEKRAKELEAEIEKLKAEMETWKDTQSRTGPARVVGVAPPPPPAKPANLATMPTMRTATAPQTLKGTVLGTGTPMVSSKVVQPTATVSSVPVSGPTTGFARSVTPGQALRNVAYTAPPPPSTGTGETSMPTEPQALEKRPIAAVSSAGPTNATKLAAVGQSGAKLPYHGSTGSPQIPGLPLAKKPSISRGVPPPVPPNKPVVPPKKEAAYLRRTETAQLPQDSSKFAKQNTSHPATSAASVLSPSTISTSSTQPSHQTVTSSSHAVEDEVGIITNPR
ncbi:CTTNBP2 N-terminal-like protein isoform X1 [Neodiprion fabricii]|uniref:CTTNBP2 N-terminal-like protein isoform X1 n=1 Tax=Neodiprion fabricii TaxID=2872261 RepID=UPI001ED968C6|nr:CTTNBP2 N-terminal-like protein isoform X1 [Neodiprion fabricii]